MLVYRLTDAYGQGVFTSGLVAKAISSFSREDGYGYTEPDPYRHPGPWEDPDLRNWWDTLFTRSHLRFGFESIPQLLAWFDSEKVRAALADLGAELRIYEVPDDHVRRGKMQCVFDMRQASMAMVRPIPLAA